MSFFETGACMFLFIKCPFHSGPSIAKHRGRGGGASVFYSVLFCFVLQQLY